MSSPRVWPSRCKHTVGTRMALFGARFPARRCLCLRFTRHLAAPGARLEVKMVRYSFLVGLFHPRLHAGLSRRTLAYARGFHERAVVVKTCSRSFTLVISPRLPRCRPTGGSRLSRFTSSSLPIAHRQCAMLPFALLLERYAPVPVGVLLFIERGCHLSTELKVSLTVAFVLPHARSLPNSAIRI